MELIICVQRYLLRKQGQLAERKITETCKNAEGKLPSKRVRPGRGRPKNPHKLHAHLTTQGDGFEACINCRRKVKDNATDASTKIKMEGRLRSPENFPEVSGFAPYAQIGLRSLGVQEMRQRRHGSSDHRVRKETENQERPQEKSGYSAAKR